MKTAIATVICLILAAGAMSPVSSRGGDDSAADLAERVAKLETLVQRDPFHPDDTVLARLAHLDKQLSAIDETSATGARLRDRDDADTAKSIDALNKRLKDMETRLRAAENPRQDPADARALREIKTDLDKLDRTLDALQSRVSRLESRRP